MEREQLALRPRMSSLPSIPVDIMTVTSSYIAAAVHWLVAMSQYTHMITLDIIYLFENKIYGVGE